MSDAYIQNLIGKEIGGGRYVIRGHLGSGGMSHVLLAQDTNLQRPVALKLLTQSLTSDQQVKTRFDAEAKAIALLEHPNIIPIFDYQPATDNASAFFAMKYLRGGTLRDRLGGGQRYTLEQAADLTRKISSALQYCHDRNIVHRDIKPSNIMFDDNGEPYVVDFGIIKDLETDRTQGFRVGTPEYMSPEQVKGTRVSGATDQYALAVVVYQSLTGQLPYLVGGNANDPSSEYGSSGRPKVKDAKTSGSFMEAALEQEPIDITLMRQDMPTAVWPVLKRAMDKEPANRWPSISEFAQEFEKAVRRQSGGLSMSRQQRNFLVIGVIVALIVVIGGLLLVLLSNAGDNNDAGATQTSVAILQTQDAINLAATNQVLTQTADAARIAAETQTAVFNAQLAAQATAETATVAAQQTFDAQSAATQTQERLDDLFGTNTAIAMTDQAVIMEITANAQAIIDAQATANAQATSVAATAQAEATNVQATVDAQATIDAEATNFEATVLAQATNVQATADAQATANAQATADAQATATQLAIVQATQDAAATLTAIPTPTPTPTLIGGSQIMGVIVYRLIDGDNHDIYRYDLATQTNQNITDTPGIKEHQPELSPDGTMLSYVSDQDGEDRDVFVLNTVTDELTQITSDDARDISPTWSPDGSQLVYASDVSGVFELYGYDFATGMTTQITSVAAEFMNRPAWSGASNRIAFEAALDGSPAQVYTINPDGSDLYAVTSDEFQNTGPNWSPDGQFIVFNSDRDAESGLGIYLINADGSDLVTLVPPEGTANYRASFSPDGTLILFNSTRTGNALLYILDRTTGEVNLLFESELQAGPAMWGP